MGSENAPAGVAATNGATAAAGDETMAEISVSIAIIDVYTFFLMSFLVNTSIPDCCAMLLRGSPAFL